MKTRKMKLFGFTFMGILLLGCVGPEDANKDKKDPTQQQQGGKRETNNNMQTPQKKLSDSGNPQQQPAELLKQLPGTCKQIPTESCNQIIGCKLGKDKNMQAVCQEDSSLTSEKCGEYNKKECTNNRDCIYSGLIGKCYDSTASNKPAPTTCKGIGESFSDGENRCKATIGCRWSKEKCVEDTSLTTGSCKNKSRQECTQAANCFWGDSIKKCFYEPDVILPEWKTCSDVPVKKCSRIFGCEADAKMCKDKDLTTRTNHMACNAKATEALCNADIRCQFSNFRNKCFAKATLTDGLNSCADVPTSKCNRVFGCALNGGVCENNTALTTVDCGAHAADADACNKDTRCRFSTFRNTCFDKGVTLATGLTGCSKVPMDKCGDMFGCTVDAGACIVDGALDNTGCDGYGDADTCNADIRCRFSDMLGACYAKGITLTAGMTKCADIPQSACANVLGCAWGAGVCEDDATLTSTAACNANHDDPAACRAVGCRYSHFIARPGAGIGMIPAGTVGRCVNPPAGGVCHLKSQDTLTTFCATHDADGVACANLQLKNVARVDTNACVYRATAPAACGIMDLSGLTAVATAIKGNDICKRFEEILTANGVAGGGDLEAACAAIHIRKADNLAATQACEWDGGGAGCIARRVDHLLVTAAGADNAAAYCAAMMAAGAATGNTSTCEGLATVITANGNSASIRGMPVCQYTAPVTAKCEPKTDAAAANLCAGYTDTECIDATVRNGAAGSANNDVCAWHAY